jgi:hypothetical protein
MCRAEEAKVDSKHTCIVVRALDRADSEFAATLSAHANAVAGCLISEVSGKEPEAIRAEAASALVQAVATANPRLDSNTSVRAHEAVVKALRDSAASIRREVGPDSQLERLHRAGDRADVQAPRRPVALLRPGDEMP